MMPPNSLRCVAFCLILASNAFAQVTLQGTVFSASTKEALPGVAVVADSQAVGLTDSVGHFAVQMNPGNHTFLFRLLGFREGRESVDVKEGMPALRILLVDEAHELGTVVVTAGRHEQRVEDVTVSMEVVKPSLAENTNATSMENVIDQVPGVNVVDGQANIRGGAGWSYGAGSRVLVLVDDMPELSADAADAKWVFIPTENLEQIEVIKGASSALFGSSALNGVINFRTASPGPKPLTKVGIYSGIYDKPVLDLDGSQYNLKWWDGTQFVSGMNFLHSRQLGEVDLTAGGNVLIDDGYRQGEFEHRYRFNINTRWRTPTPGLSVGINANAQTASGALFFIWKDDTTGAYIPLENTLSDYTNNKYTVDPYLTYFNKRGDSHKLRSRYFNNTNTNNTNQNSTSEVYFGEYQYQHTSKSKALVLTGGASSQYSHVTSELYGDHHGTNFAFYAQGDLHAGKFNFSAGARVEQNSIDTVNDDAVAVFRAGVNYHVFQATWLRASAGQGYRYPTIAERYVSTTVGIVGIYPNPSLEPENGFSTEFGIRQIVRLGEWKGYVDVAAFLNRYDNMMEFAFAQWGPQNPPLYGLGFSSVNVGNTEIKGVELSFGGSGNIGKKAKLDILAGYTYMDPRQVSYNDFYVQKTGVTEYMGSDSSNFLKYRYRHLARFDADFAYEKWFVGGSARYNSFMVNIDKAFTYDAVVPGVGHYRDHRQDGDLVVDARLGYRFNPQWKAAFICKNVFNYIFMQRPADMQPPRTFVIQVNLEI